MLTFLAQLFDTGEITVLRQTQADSDDIQQLLQHYESISAKEWPGVVPDFDVEVAEKSANVLLTFCQAAVYRDLDEIEVQWRLNAINPVAHATTSCHYSADLLLQFLGDVYSFLVRSSDEDPVLQVLTDFAKSWPLAAVGIPNTAPDRLPEFLAKGSMQRAYVGRVIARGDEACCRIPEVVNSVKAAIGDFPILAPKLDAVLKSSE